ARRNGGTMILRIDDTDISRNTQASLDSVFDGLNWLELGWDERYRQSNRLDLHRQAVEAMAGKGHAYRISLRRKPMKARSPAPAARGCSMPGYVSFQPRRAAGAPPRASPLCGASACRANRAR